MAPITPTCKRLLLPLALVAASPAVAAQEASDIYWNAKRLEMTGRGAEALKGYAKLLARNPESEAAANKLLQAALREGSMADALLAVQAAEKAEVADSDAPLLRYVDAFRRKKWGDASKAVAQLEAGQNFGFLVPMLAGWLNVAQGKASDVTAARLRDNGLSAYYGDDQLVYFELAENNLPQAKLLLRNFGGYAEPHGRFLAANAVGVFLDAGDNEFAGALARQIGLAAGRYTYPKLTAEIGLAAMFARLALALDEQKQPEKALYFARLATWSAPQSDAAKLAFAQAAKANEMEDSARSALGSISVASPFWLQAVIEQSELAPSPDAAVAIVQAAVTQRPNSPQLKLLLAQTFERAGQRDKAIPVYRSLLDNDKAGIDGRQRAVYLLLLATALDASGEWDGARNALEDAIIADPANPQALNYLGYSLLERRIDVKRGFDLVAKAHQLAPQSAAITDSLGWAHFLKGDIAAAIPLLEKAVAGAIDDPAINEHLGDAYWGAGRKTEARFAWKAAALVAQGKTAERLTQKIDLGWTVATAAP